MDRILVSSRYRFFTITFNAVHVCAAKEDQTMNRPEYVKCVGFGDIEIIDGKKTWCGVDYGLAKPFVDIDHAALNGKNEGRFIVCGHCRHEIIKAISHGCKYL